MAARGPDNTRSATVMGKIVNLRLWKLLHTPAPWETRSESKATIHRLRRLLERREPEPDDTNPNTDTTIKK